jgi:hypothetical protein
MGGVIAINRLRCREMAEISLTGSFSWESGLRHDGLAIFTERRAHSFGVMV